MQTKKSPAKKLENYSTVFMLLGLCLSLFITYGFIEYKSYFESSDGLETTTTIEIPDDESQIITYVKEKKVKMEPMVKEPIEVKPIPKDTPMKIVSNDNDTKIESTVIEDVIPDVNPDHESGEVDLNAIYTEDEPTEYIPDDVPFISVSRVPVYPGCENKKDKKKCFKEKVTKHVHSFDTTLGEKLGLNGTQKIYCLFKVNHLGRVSDIQVRSAHKKLTEEARELIGDIPNMVPAYHNGKNVNISYMVPIIFKVE